MSDKNVERELIKKFKPPVKSLEFKKYWRKFLLNVTSRDNFNDTHLKGLEVLCQLFVEYDRMTSFLNEYYETNNSYSYTTRGGRNGDQIKTIPEMIERRAILSEIRQYSRMLGIILNKDNTNNGDQEVNEWE